MHRECHSVNSAPCYKQAYSSAPWTAPHPFWRSGRINQVCNDGVICAKLWLLSCLLCPSLVNMWININCKNIWFLNLHHIGAESWVRNYEIISQSATDFVTGADICGTTAKQQASRKKIRGGVCAATMKPVANIYVELVTALSIGKSCFIKKVLYRAVNREIKE